MSRCGFTIELFSEWRDAVTKSGLSQSNIDRAIAVQHRQWLDGCGFDAMFDPDEDPVERWKEKKLGTPRKLGKNARKLYGAHEIRVQWGEWGPEHITVPGNACGLDLDHGLMSRSKESKSLIPHNIDTFSQVILLLTIFTSIADYLIDQ